MRVKVAFLPGKDTTASTDTLKSNTHVASSNGRGKAIISIFLSSEAFRRGRSFG